MDCRCHRRERLRLRAELWCGSERLGCFMTRDISPEGAFVETGPVDVRPHEMIASGFHLGSTGAGRHELPALVIHQSDEGMGLMYVGFSADFWHDLEAAMEAAA